jgi:hypothetical protein
VQQVVERHYDPAYARFSARNQRPVLDSVAIADFGELARSEAAQRIAGVMKGWAG